MQADQAAVALRCVGGSGEAEKSTCARRRPKRKITNGMAISAGGRPKPVLTAMAHGTQGFPLTRAAPERCSSAIFLASQVSAALAKGIF